LREDILKYIAQFYRSGEGDESITEMLGRLELGEEREEEEEDLVSESDSVIMQLVNKIINDANTRRASDIHIEPSVRKKNVDIRFRIDGGLCPLSNRSIQLQGGHGLEAEDHVQP